MTEQEKRLNLNKLHPNVTVEGELHLTAFGTEFFRQAIEQCKRAR